MASEALEPPRTRAIGGLSSTALVRLRGGDDFDDDFDDDLAPPVPSIWHDRNRPDGGYAGPWRLPEEVRSGVIGFVLGLAVVVPIALFASGHFDGGGLVSPTGLSGPSVGAEIIADGRGATPLTTGNADGISFPTFARTSTSREIASSETRLPEPQTVIESLVVTPERRTSRFARQTTPPPRVNPDLVVMEARGLIANGDLDGARRLLESARTTSSNGEVLFLLAETYDPKTVAAWGLSDREADADKARGIYMMALLAGVERAVSRIKPTKSAR